MASYTPNYNLYKPANSDPHGDFIAEFAHNMDIIDAYLGSGGSGGVKILRNQSLSFTGLVATVSDSDITADSNYIVYYHDVTLAENAGITTVASSGVITFTAVTAPSNTIVVNIVLLDVNGGGGGSGGHTIIDDSGNDMPQEAGLQFTGNVNITDDSVNGKTIVDISGGGNSVVLGAYIDTDRVITSGTYSSNFSYTATEDCYLCLQVIANANDSAVVTIDSETVANEWSSATHTSPIILPVRKGQIVGATSSNPSTAYYFVYGVKQGTNGIFAPVIFSDNERMIGVWRDNKPLYQRTYAVTYGTSDTTIQLDFSPEVLMFVSGGTYNKQNSTGNMVSYGFYVSSTDRLQIYYQSNSNSLLVQSVDSYITGTGYVTIRYTKTTDVAGSGNWNTDGVPTVHYSTSEQVIGTWIDGKTIYQRIITGLSLTTSRGTAYTITIQDHGIAQFIDSICLSTQTQYRTVMHPPTWLSDANTIVIRSEENDTFDTLIIQYTKA